MRKRLTWLAALLLACAAPRTGTLSLAADPWPPYVDPALPGEGVAATIVRTALSRAGFETTFTVAEWSFVLAEARAGRFDAIADAWQSAERERDFDFSDPYLENEIVLVKKRSAPFTFEQVRSGERHDLVLGLVRDYAYGDALASLKKMPTRIHAYLTESLLHLVQGDIDVVLGDARAIRHHVHEFLRAHESELEISSEPLARLPLRLAVSRARPDHERIVAAFDRELAAMRADGTLARLLAESP